MPSPRLFRAEPHPHHLQISTSPQPTGLDLGHQNLRYQQTDYTGTHTPQSTHLTPLTASQRPVALTFKTPTEDLRKSLDESKKEALRRLENDRAKTDQHFENWNKALEAFALGWRKPKPYYPVIISPSSPVSTPQKLQEMAGMTAPPPQGHQHHLHYHARRTR